MIQFPTIYYKGYNPVGREHENVLVMISEVELYRLHACEIKLQIAYNEQDLEQLSWDENPDQITKLQNENYELLKQLAMCVAPEQRIVLKINLKNADETAIVPDAE